MTTYPWMDDTPTLLAVGDADVVGGMAHTALCVVLTQAGDTFELPVIDGTLSFDETHTPRVGLDLTCHLLTDQALMARIDPRLDCRVRLAVGYIRPDGLVDVQEIANLGLRTRTRNRPEDTMTLTAKSDEALVIDNTATTSLTVSASSIAQGIADVVHLDLPSATVNFDVAAMGPAVSQSSLDASKWDTIMDLADRLGGVAVYDDGTRAWWVQDRHNSLDEDEVALTLATGPSGTLTSITENNDRDDTSELGWYNRVKATYKWTDTGGTDHRVVAVADATGAFAPTTGNVKTLEVEREVPTTSTDAANAAATLAARTVTRGRTYTLTAPSTYWLRPGHTVSLVEEGRDPEMHLVQAVEFDLQQGLMTLTTRQPDTSLGIWDDVKPYLSWDAVADDVTWDTWYEY